MTAVNFTQNVNPGTSGLTISSGASTTITVIEDNTPKSFTTYSTPYNVADVEIAGKGNTVLINHTADCYYDDPYVGASGEIEEFHRHRLINATSGGSDTDTGWVTFNSTAIYHSGTTGAWSNLNNAKVSDGTFATATADVDGYVDFVNFYDFDFSSLIPSGATLNDIQVRIKIKTAAGTSNMTVCMCWDGAGYISPIDHSNYWVQAISATNVEYNRGGTGCHLSKWKKEDDMVAHDGGFPLTMSMIRDPNFGISIRPVGTMTGVVSIDYVGVKVWYTTKDVVKENINRTYALFRIGADLVLDRTPVRNSMVANLTDGESYHYTVDQIATGNTTGAWIYATNTNRTTVIQEIK